MPKNRILSYMWYNQPRVYAEFCISVRIILHYLSLGCSKRDIFDECAPYDGTIDDFHCELMVATGLANLRMLGYKEKAAQA